LKKLALWLALKDLSIKKVFVKLENNEGEIAMFLNFLISFSFLLSKNKLEIF